MNNKKLSIAYIAPGWPLNHYPNGIVTYVQNLLVGLNNVGNFETKVLAYQVGEITDCHQKIINLSLQDSERTIVERLQDIFWLRINTSLGIKNISTRKIIKAINQMDPVPDLLEVEESFGLASKIIPYVRFPVVTRLHGPWFIHAPILHKQHEQDFRYRVKSEGRAIALSQGVTAPSLDVLNQVRCYYNLDLFDAAVIPNPVAEVVPALRWAYSKSENPSLLFVGRFDRHKGGDLMLDAFRLVALNNPDILLNFVGPDCGVIWNGQKLSFWEYLNAFLPESTIRNRVKFLGHCSSETICKLRQRALITVMTSRYENFPLSLVEALSAGCPVVATAVGGVKEIIKDDVNGVLAQPESAEDLAEKIIGLIDKPAKMKMLSQNAIEDCLIKYHPNVIAKHTLDFYKMLL